MPDSKTGRLLPDEVRYLSFEGGGGKGAAYLGVLIVFLLPEFSVFKKGKNDLTYLSDSILGIAGTSAGAITAALLGSGVPLEELIAMMLDYKPSKDPSIIEYQNKPILDAFLDLDLNSSAAIVPNFFRKDGFERRRSALFTEIGQAAGDVTDNVLGRIPSNLINDVRYLIEKFVRDKTLLSTDEIVTAIDRVLFDDGLIPGVVMYRHILYLINKYNPEYAERKKDSPKYNDLNKPLVPDAIGTKIIQVEPSLFTLPGMTFEQAYNKYKRYIVITGSNLSRGQVTYFSNKDSLTPHFSIAAATRISSSIPVMFKPIKIPRSALNGEHFSLVEQNILTGTWSDGGVVNNHPFHVFDLKRTTDITSLTPYFTRGELNPSLLPIILTDSTDMYEQRIVKSTGDVVDGLFSQLGKVLEIMTENSTEAQYRSQVERDRTLKVPTETADKKFKLQTEVFNPNRLTVMMVVNEVIKETLEYFNLGADKYPLLKANIENLQVGEQMKALLLYVNKNLNLG